MRGSRQLSERRSAPASRCGGADADPKQQSRRDLRLDLFRGLSLLVIFIDHIPNNVLSYVTLHSIAFSDAAEVFIFISGYAAATVYGRALPIARTLGSIISSTNPKSQSSRFSCCSISPSSSTSSRST